MSPRLPRHLPSTDPPLTARGSLRWAVVEPILAGLHPTTVVEIGCGQGAVGARIARHAAYTGVEPDLASSELAAARVTARGGAVLHGDSRVLPWGSTYDVVCAFEVLEHIEEEAAALRAWVSHTRKGGHVLLSVPEDPDRFGPSDVQVGHYRRYTEESLTEALAGAGLEVVSVQHYGWPLGYLLEAVSHRAARRALASESGDDTRAGDNDDDDDLPDVADAADLDGTAGDADWEAPGRRAVGSGGWLQPGAVAGAVLRVGVRPFARVQGRRTDRGTGLIALARRPH
jgi:SAM-dependent methyltransferase